MYRRRDTDLRAFLRGLGYVAAFGYWSLVLLLLLIGIGEPEKNSDWLYQPRHALSAGLFFGVIGLLFVISRRVRYGRPAFWALIALLFAIDWATDGQWAV
jgi:hypothetical protein